MHMQTKRKLALSTNVISLSEKCVTLNGHVFFPREDMWRIQDSSQMTYFNFLTLRDYCTAEMIFSLKKTCCWYLENMSATHSCNMFKMFKKLIEEITDENESLSVITSHHIINYRGHLPSDKEWYLTSLAGFLRKWHALGYEGIETDTINLLELMTLKGNEKGFAVLTMDPLEGPFTELELHSIHRAINLAFGRGEIGNREFALVWLFMATGARPVQIADIKICDFYSQGEKYWINVPRAKQRKMKRRSAFKKRPLAKEIGVVLESWISQIKMEYDLLHGTDGVDSKQLPIFPDWNKRGDVAAFAYHTVGSSLSNEVTNIFRILEVRSHRTKEPMRITPQRFRYTLGTRAAMEKQGALVIAELLDHSDTQNVIVYTKATPEIVKILDEALAVELGALSQAFAGKIILDDFDTGRPDDVRSVRVPRLDPKAVSVGKCGTCVGCEARLPYGCYVCNQFEAWLEGPHEEVLMDLLDERKLKLKESGDETMAFANDHIILAVANVMDMCKKLRASKGEGQ